MTYSPARFLLLVPLAGACGSNALAGADNADTTEGGAGGGGGGAVAMGGARGAVRLIDPANEMLFGGTSGGGAAARDCGLVDGTVEWDDSAPFDAVVGLDNGPDTTRLYGVQLGSCGTPVLCEDIACLIRGWSQDRRHVAFEVLDRPSGKNKSVIVSADGERQEFPEAIVYAWSPDSEHLAFADAEGVRIGDARGNDAVPVELPASLPDVELAWSADGSRLVVVTPTDVFVANADGTNPRNVASFANRGGASAFWRPNSETLAVTYSEGAVEIVGVDGTVLARTSTSPGRPFSIGWSADSAWYAFVDGAETTVMSVDGEFVITPEPMFPNALGAWSPGGATLAMGARGGLMLWSPASSLNVPIELEYEVPAGTSGGWIYPLSWSPDGSRLLYEQSRGGGPDDHSAIVDANSGAALARFVRSRASWNSSGSHVLLSCTSRSGESCWGSSIDSTRAFVVVDADGGGQMPILAGAYDGAWLADGEHVAVTAPDSVLISRHDASDQYTLPIANGRLVLPARYP